MTSLITALAFLAPVLVVACIALLFVERLRTLGAHALVLGLVCGAKLALGWLLLSSISAVTGYLTWSSGAMSFGAGFTGGSGLAFVWYLANRPRPNNSFNPMPLRGTG